LQENVSSADEDDIYDGQESTGSGNVQFEYEHFIPDGDKPIRHDSAITKGQAVVLLMSFILRHKLTGVAVDDLLDLLAVLAPDVCLPTSKFLLTKGLFDKTSCVQVHLYCPFCNAYIGRYSYTETFEKCHTCEFAITREACIKDGNFYLYMPIEQQLKVLLNKLPLLRKTVFNDQNNLTSILSGSVLQNHVANAEITDDDITLIWNCDGAPVFSSSKKSIWPLQACINELPATSKDNLLLIGLWFGKEKPWSYTYLKPFVDELKHLGTHGMQYVNADNDTVSCKVFSLCCSSDSCARPMLRETTQFNGRYGCDWCLNEGQTIKRGDGVSRVYVPSHVMPELRDSESFVKDSLDASVEHPVRGVKGVSPLLFLPLFNIVTGFVPDYLHCVLLGVVRTFSGLWFDSSNHSKPWYVGQLGVSKISRQLVSLRPPSDVSRLPRSLSERRFWKGSEWRSFLLYYSVLVLRGILPAKYLNHWFLLVFSIHILLQESVSKADVLLSEKVLLDFATSVSALYGIEHCTFNVHQLLHLPAAVLNWGPLWAFSCFRFEGNIGQILSLVKGSNCVPLQVFRAFATRKTLPTVYDQYSTVKNITLESLLKRLWCSGIYIRKTSVVVNDIHLYGRPVVRKLSLCESLAISHLTGIEPKPATFRVYKRMHFNSSYITSSDYKVSNRHCDDTVQLVDGRFCIVSSCIVGTLLCSCADDCYCTDTVVLLISILEKVAQRSLFRHHKLSISSDRFVSVTRQSALTSCVRPSDVSRKCFRFESGTFMYVVPVPTKMEAD